MVGEVDEEGLGGGVVDGADDELAYSGDILRFCFCQRLILFFS